MTDIDSTIGVVLCCVVLCCVVLCVSSAETMKVAEKLTPILTEQLS
jgi:hypothetical protein